MEEILRYIGSNYPTIIRLTIEHLYLVSISVGAAILSGVPIGILITKDKKLADAVLYLASVIITIPSVAMFGLMIPLLSLVNRGIGFWPAAQPSPFFCIPSCRLFATRTRLSIISIPPSVRRPKAWG